VPVESAVAARADWVRRRENASPAAELFSAAGGTAVAAH
jgi:hypothetical protein